MIQLIKYIEKDIYELYYIYFLIQETIQHLLSDNILHYTIIKIDNDIITYLLLFDSYIVE